MGNASWEDNSNHDRRSDINRLDCYLEQTSASIAKLLAESDAVLRSAMKREKVRLRVR
jgi:hypothetical protein